IRTMDCIDCHNRPTHIYLSSESALNDLLSRNLIDRGVPWIRKFSEEVLVPEYATTEEAMQGIARLPRLYQEREPEVWTRFREQIETAVAPLQDIHRLYVYPQMRVRWNTYPSLIGHPVKETLACFRCHDGLLRDQTGQAITTECHSCHYILARQERNPEILKMFDGN
ncbi:MAG: cytochrome C, partial [bacterium]